MPRINVVLVEPQIEGNVGAIARSMANFGHDELVLVHSRPPGDEAYRRARHGGYILDNARHLETVEESLNGVDLSVGTTGVPGGNEKAFHRHTHTPWELRKKLEGTDGTVALVLGREDHGLRNDDLARLDLVVNVPCNPEYPILNISHAATILFYELNRGAPLSLSSQRRLASGFEKEQLMTAFREFLRTTKYPHHRSRRTEVMFRRLVARAIPSKWEFHALMGALRGASKTVKRLSESPGPGPSS